MVAYLVWEGYRLNRWFFVGSGLIRLVRLNALRGHRRRGVLLCLALAVYNGVRDRIKIA